MLNCLRELFRFHQKAVVPVGRSQDGSLSVRHLLRQQQLLIGGEQPIGIDAHEQTARFDGPQNGFHAAPPPAHVV